MPAPRRALLAAALCTALGLLAAPQAQAAEAPITIMVGGINKLIYLPAKLTEALGYFKDEGLQVELQSQPAGVDAENQLIAGAVQAVVGFYDHTVDLQSKGKEVTSIAQLLLVPGGTEMVRTDLAGSVRSMADVKGRTLGVTGLGASSSFITQYLAARSGLKSSDFSMLPVGAGSTLIAAFKQKRIDVAWVTEPTTSILRESGDAKVLVDMTTTEGSRQAMGGLYPASSVYVQRSWMLQHKAEAGKLARAFARTMKYIATHTPEDIAAKMPADYYGGNKPLYVQALKASMGMYSPDGKMPAGGPEQVLKVLAGFNPNIKGKNIDLSKTYTNEFVQGVK